MSTKQQGEDKDETREWEREKEERQANEDKKETERWEEEKKRKRDQGD